MIFTTAYKFRCFSSNMDRFAWDTSGIVWATQTNIFGIKKIITCYVLPCGVIATNWFEWHLMSRKPWLLYCISFKRHSKMKNMRNVSTVYHHHNTFPTPEVPFLFFSSYPPHMRLIKSLRGCFTIINCIPMYIQRTVCFVHTCSVWFLAFNASRAQPPTRRPVAVSICHLVCHSFSKIW